MKSKNVKKNVKKNVNTKGKQQNSKFLAAIAVGAFLLLIVFFIIFSEAVVSGKITISNETSIDIENVSIYFDNVNSEYYSYIGAEPFHSGNLISTDVLAGDKAKEDFSKVDMYNLDAELCVNVTVDGEAIEFYTGEFNESFKGKIDVIMYEEDGEEYITIKAKTGVFGLFSKVKCNVTYKLR